MVDVAQLVEPWIVIPVVVGSSPIVHPKSRRKKRLARATAFFVPVHYVGGRPDIIEWPGSWQRPGALA